MCVFLLYCVIVVGGGVCTDVMGLLRDLHSDGDDGYDTYDRIE